LQHLFGSNIVSLFDGIVTYIGFSGAGGYTVTIKNESFTASYCHVSPLFLVYIGKIVNQGDIIAKIGPKNVYSAPNNPYSDSNGNPTNGATTGPHLHLTLKLNGKAVDPLKYF
jgi:murein DD-endopeptidase